MIRADATATTNIPSKIEMFPVEKNIILVRFENIADNFDGPHNASTPNDTTYSIDVKYFAQELYSEVNGPNATLN